jgi:hypothetical protein
LPFLVKLFDCSPKRIFLTPLVLTIKTLRFVNTEYLTAFRAAPPFFFVSNEMPYPESSNVLEVADHAHAIFDSIPLIQMVELDAREAVTTEAVFDFGVHYLLTVLDSTCDAGCRFVAVLTSATGAWFLISCVCAAEAAIHSAGSD